MSDVARYNIQFDVPSGRGEQAASSVMGSVQHTSPSLERVTCTVEAADDLGALQTISVLLDESIVRIGHTRVWRAD